MAKITFQQISGHLEKLRNIYKTINEDKFKQDIKELDQAIELYSSLQYGATIPIDPISSEKTEEPPKKQRKINHNHPGQKNKFEHAIQLLSEQKYNELTGTKLNYQAITNEEDAIQLLNELTDSQVLKHTTALDLKLLYCILTGESKELKAKKKEEILNTIKQNIRATKRGEAFTKTI
jgi:hypothetical protein